MARKSFTCSYFTKSHCQTNRINCMNRFHFGPAFVFSQCLFPFSLSLLQNLWLSGTHTYTHTHIKKWWTQIFLYQTMVFVQLKWIVEGKVQRKLSFARYIDFSVFWYIVARSCPFRNSIFFVLCIFTLQIRLISPDFLFMHVDKYGDMKGKTMYPNSRDGIETAKRAFLQECREWSTKEKRLARKCIAKIIL